MIFRSYFSQLRLTFLNNPPISTTKNTQTGSSSNDKTPPIYSVPSQRERSGSDRNSRRCSAPYDSPMSPPLPARPAERHYSETSSEGPDQPGDNLNKVTTRFP